jgi:DNA (cytosine-5)-methyltransferase 1
MNTIATLFTGGGFVNVGAKAAGLQGIWDVESEPDIAAVAEANGFSAIVARVQDVDYSSLEAPFWLHMSPPCTRASQANTEGGETELDVELAQACIRAIRVLNPPMVSLENVLPYRKFESFRVICHALREAGYAVEHWHLNSADYGVAQTRRRLFLVASRIGKPRKPTPTHQKRREGLGQLTLFEPLPAWRGWYEAIEDLIPELPEDEFAPWQVPLLPIEIQTMLIAQGKYGDKLVTVNAGEQAFTVTANSGIRGVLIRCDNQNQEWGKDHREPDEPAITVTAAKGIKAYLVNQDSKMGVYAPDNPAMTGLSSQKSAYVRAFIVDGQANDNGETITIRGDEEPFFVASASQAKRPVRAYTSGRVVRMTPRCLARFQSVPDTYILPEKASLACTVIGNGVPCLMAEVLIRANLNCGKAKLLSEIVQFQR